MTTHESGRELARLTRTARSLGAAGVVGLACLLAACGAEAPGPSSAAYDATTPGLGRGADEDVVRPEPRVRAVPDDPSQRRALRVLSNGCRYSPRGIPSCGALVGAAYGGNRDPAEWEGTMGRGLGIRRTYWGAGDVAAALRTARDDLARQRLPWMSFKLPYSWEAMREGRGDDWVRSLAQELATLDGPVWLALHHEPEGDGDITAWTAMQARLAPIVRRLAPNVAYSIILTGWNQFFGESRYALGSLWPEGTRIDLVGFDVFNRFGAEKDGTLFEEHTRLRRDYFPGFEVFARQRGMAWGLAETGYTDESAEVDPAWMGRTYEALLAHGGVAFTYFNSTLNSAGSWHLDGAKQERFATLLRTTPSL